MTAKIIHRSIALALITALIGGCKTPDSIAKIESKSVPESYFNAHDSTNIAQTKWKTYFSDPNLIALIDTALLHNQELNIVLQEIEISKNEVKARKGEYLPFINFQGGAATEKEGRYTRHGAVDHNLEIKPGTEFPDPLQDYMLGIYASWELDVWKKLRNAKQAAVARYLASIEGKNFMVTHLIAEIANSYYELIALDNQLEIIEKNIQLQSSVLHIIHQQKDAAMVTQLAVNRFEAQLLHTQNRLYETKQQRMETENRLNFLTGRFPKPIPRNADSFNNTLFTDISAGIPAQLLANRPDIRQAELELAASKLDVKTARANFYPSLRLESGIGFRAFNPSFLINPESILYSVAGDLMAPLINRNAIKATYRTANAKQIQAIYAYEQTILNAYIEVMNQLSRNDNFKKSFAVKSKEVEILTQSINIANNLFKSARADYAEVLLTQREALESRMELIEIRMKQLHAKINIYKALGGGWN